MKTQKMSLSNMKGKLSRTEMKNISAGMMPPGYNHCYTVCSNGTYESPNCDTSARVICTSQGGTYVDCYCV